MNDQLINYRFYGIGAVASFILLFVVPILIGVIYYYNLHGNLSGLDPNKAIDTASQTLIVRVALVLMCVLFYFLAVMMFSFFIETFLKAQKGIQNQNHSTVSFIEAHKYQIVSIIQKVILVMSIFAIISFQRLYKKKMQKIEQSNIQLSK